MTNDEFEDFPTEDYEPERNIDVYAECNGEFIPEEKTKFVDIEEDISGSDVITFICPICQEQHKSLRFG